MEFLYRQQRRKRKVYNQSQLLEFIDMHNIRTISAAWDRYQNELPLSENRELYWQCYCMFRDNGRIIIQ